LHSIYTRLHSIYTRLHSIYTRFTVDYTKFTVDKYSKPLYIGEFLLPISHYPTDF